jgi:hypothetical protein
MPIGSLFVEEVEDLPISVVEARSFVTTSEGVLTAEEVMDLKVFLAFMPEAGVVIPGCGGIRKLRWGAKGKGKRGGARVIYYSRSAAMPIVLLAVYAKGERIDISAAEKRQLTNLIPLLVREFMRTRRN